MIFGNWLLEYKKSWDVKLQSRKIYFYKGEALARWVFAQLLPPRKCSQWDLHIAHWVKRKWWLWLNNITGLLLQCCQQMLSLLQTCHLDGKDSIITEVQDLWIRKTLWLPRTWSMKIWREFAVKALPRGPSRMESPGGKRGCRKHNRNVWGSQLHWL